MMVVETIAQIRELVRQAIRQEKKVGCVPTMGALHQGHLSLIEQARKESDFVVVTIFVNPTQFGPGEDFQKYPRTLQRDLELCESVGADVVFCPEVGQIYNPEPQLKVVVGSLSQLWEGAVRPGHFDGVATIVAKLFNIVQPQIAFFGAKDYQQLAIIKALCRDLNLPVEIVTCPTVRTPEGLAMSSRNAYLSEEELRTALSLSQALKQAAQAVESGSLSLAEIRQQMQDFLSSQPGVILDYATIADRKTLQELDEYQPEMVVLIAARVGQTRLIDNQELSWAKAPLDK